MSAIYWVTFDDGRLVSVSSADAKSLKRPALMVAYRKALKKAEAKHRKTNPKAKAVNVRCVG